jgi:putative hemolysin
MRSTQSIKDLHMLIAVESQDRPRSVGRGLSVALARTPADIEAAQRLRYRVFVDEMGARVAHRRAGLDEDMFDSWCEHLVVRDDATEEVVGTYRVLDPSSARRLGLYYAETEFDLTRLQLLRAGIGEVGRACIHPDYRTGGAITRLWQGIASLALARGFRYLIGCASMSMADGGVAAAHVASRVLPSHLAPIEYRVFPRHPLVPPEVDRDLARDGEALVPPLLRAYLRLGAWVGGDPAWDPDFNTADFFVFLPLDRVAQRYARHYLKAA